MSTATSLAWEDLLTQPFLWGGDRLEDGGLDCYGISRIVCERLGLYLPEISRDGVKEDWLADCDHHAKFIGPAPTGRWRREKYRLGDLLASDPNLFGCASHLAVFVDMKEMLVLSTFEGHGACVLPAWKMAPATYGIWRPASL